MSTRREIPNDRPMTMRHNEGSRYSPTRTKDDNALATTNERWTDDNTQRVRTEDKRITTHMRQQTTRDNAQATTNREQSMTHDARHRTIVPGRRDTMKNRVTTNDHHQATRRNDGPQSSPTSEWKTMMRHQLQSHDHTTARRLTTNERPSTTRSNDGPPQPSPMSERMMTMHY